MWLCRAGEPREKSEYLSGRLSSMALMPLIPISALAHILLRAYSQNLGCSILHCHKSATTLGCLPLPENVVTSVIHSCLLLGSFCPYTSSVFLKKKIFLCGVAYTLRTQESASEGLSSVWGKAGLHSKAVPGRGMGKHSLLTNSFVHLTGDTAVTTVKRLAWSLHSMLIARIEPKSPNPFIRWHPLNPIIKRTWWGWGDGLVTQAQGPECGPPAPT